MTFEEYEYFVSGLTTLFQEYVNPDIEEIEIGVVVSCIGTTIVTKYLEDLHIGISERDVVISYPEDDRRYAKEKVNLLYNTLMRKSNGLNQSSHI